MKGRGFMGTAMAISNIYAEREKFIIIGLTGRTGSGCTTVSEILEKENFKDLCLHEPKTTNFISNEERKYQIIYDYAQNHWNKFISITMTDIIFSFILEKNFSSFNKIYIDLFSKYIRFLYKGIIIKHNKTEPTYTKTSLFLCEKRRFFMARREKGVVPIIYFEKERGKSF